MTPRLTFPRQKKNPGIYSIGGWVGPRDVLDVFEKMKHVLPLPGRRRQDNIMKKVSGYCEQVNGPEGYTKCGGLLDKPRKCQLFKNDPVQQSYIQYQQHGGCANM